MYGLGVMTLRKQNFYDDKTRMTWFNLSR